MGITNQYLNNEWSPQKEQFYQESFYQRILFESYHSSLPSEKKRITFKNRPLLKMHKCCLKLHPGSFLQKQFLRSKIIIYCLLLQIQSSVNAIVFLGLTRLYLATQLTHHLLLFFVIVELKFCKFITVPQPRGKILNGSIHNEEWWFYLP